MLTRRRFIVLLGAAAAGAGGLASCSSHQQSSTPKDAASPGEGFEARFSGFEPAVEPDGDLAKVVWPRFVTDAGPEVRQLYEFQITHGELMRYMPCFCGCGQDAGHRSNRDCYVKQVNADGTVVLDLMAPT